MTCTCVSNMSVNDICWQEYVRRLILQTYSGRQFSVHPFQPKQTTRVHYCFDSGLCLLNMLSMVCSMCCSMSCVLVLWLMMCFCFWVRWWFWRCSLLVFCFKLFVSDDVWRLLLIECSFCVVSLCCMYCALFLCLMCSEDKLCFVSTMVDDLQLRSFARETS
jgi:hypothetical protein